MLIQDQVSASLVFNVTSYLNIIGIGMDPEKDFTWYPMVPLAWIYIPTV
ncbi:MAG: hypothetical protein CM15mP62_25130 [Rhodospirillaceae bacterium]|nr:MAG: hypothetical protein CM15mP62_25130 [Rhodospirillaceae bacterium]